MDKQRIAEVLAKARTILIKKRWEQGNYVSKTREGNVYGVCAVGALVCAYDELGIEYDGISGIEHEEDGPIKYLERHSGAPVSSFNDREETIKRDVVSLYDAAIRDAASQSS